MGVKWSRLTGLNVCSHEQNCDGNEECLFYLSGIRMAFPVCSEVLRALWLIYEAIL